MTILAALLPRLLPRAIDWVQSQEKQVLVSGRALTDIEAKLAVAVGVRDPDRVRLKYFTQIPQPDHPELRALGIQAGLLGPHIGGITCGHGIYIRAGHATNPPTS